MTMLLLHAMCVMCDDGDCVEVVVVSVEVVVIVTDVDCDADMCLLW